MDGLKMNEDDTVSYRISASGSKSPYSGDYWWSLKINRLPDDRSYIIRDIKGLLNQVKKKVITKLEKIIMKFYLF
ncbi:hypothetical protein ACR31S_09175 [Streptococcus iniae]